MKFRFAFVFLSCWITLGLGNPRPRPTPTPRPTATPTPPPSSKNSYLKLHPQNPRYFQDATTGAPVMIAAFHNVVPTDKFFDYNQQIEALKNNGVTYTRIWHFFATDGSPDVLIPWGRSSTGGAPMGGNKADFDQWNPEYWSRLRDALQKTTHNGITAQIIVFDRVGIFPADHARWETNPWALENNINGVETAPARGDGIPEFYQTLTRPTLRKYQESYVRKLIDETVDLNVIYEVENEHWQNNDSTFGHYWGQYIKNYLATKYPQHQRLVSYNSLENDLNDFLRLTSVDIINKHIPDVVRMPAHVNHLIETRWKFAKPINIDEFANGETNYPRLRELAWTIVTGGGHFHIEDAEPEARPFDIVKNIKNFIAQSGWNFINSAPDRFRTLAGYCMVQENAEYVCYYPKGGNRRVNITAGSYSVRWWNPRDQGHFTGELSVNHGGGWLSLTTPDSQDWVVQIKTTQNLPLQALKEPVGSTCVELGYDTPYDGECPAPRAHFMNDVFEAQDRVISEFPELFNFNDAPSGWPKILSGDVYHQRIVDLLTLKGYCAIYDGEEIWVKRNNASSEQYDLMTGPGYVRRKYSTTCSPSQVIEFLHTTGD